MVTLGVTSRPKPWAARQPAGRLLGADRPSVEAQRHQDLCGKVRRHRYRGGPARRPNSGEPTIDPFGMD